MTIMVVTVVPMVTVMTILVSVVLTVMMMVLVTEMNALCRSYDVTMQLQGENFSLRSNFKMLPVLPRL